jgi:hypothetical protein
MATLSVGGYLLFSAKNIPVYKLVSQNQELFVAKEVTLD